MDAITLLVAFGVGFGLQHKLPFLRGRFQLLDSLLDCSFCTGFHSGWLTWVLAWSSTGQLPAEGWRIPGSCLTWALASAGFFVLADAVLSRLER